MSKKLELKDAPKTLPECISCFERITNHVNSVMGGFELQANDLFDNVEKKTNDSLKTIGQRTDKAITVHLKNQEQKHDEAFAEHLKVQDIKYDIFLEKADKRDNRRSNFNILILTLFASVIAYSYIRQDALNSEVQLKANKKEIPTMNEIRMLRDLGDEYNRSVFVKKQIITADTSAYFWAKKNIYGSQLRSENNNLKN